MAHRRVQNEFWNGTGNNIRRRLRSEYEPFTRVYEGALRKEPADNFFHWRMLF